MTGSKQLPAWVWPLALVIFLVGMVFFVRVFKEERQRQVRLERKLGTLEELQGLAETRLPVLGAEARLAEVAGASGSDPAEWFRKENVAATLEKLPAVALSDGMVLVRRKAIVRNEDPVRVNEALRRLQEVRPPWAVEKVTLNAQEQDRIDAEIIIMSISKKADN